MDRILDSEEKLKHETDEKEKNFLMRICEGESRKAGAEIASLARYEVTCEAFEKYLNDAGYEKTACLDHEIRKVCKIAFFENFVEKYQLTECKKRHDVS